MTADLSADLADRRQRDLIAGAGDGLEQTLFVEAGAGSGKTTALVDRIVALVESGDVELAQVAAITFTEKAAAELRDRVRERLEEERRSALESGDDAREERLRAAVEQVDVAAICTLHAFAQRILTEHPIEAGLPPNIEVLDEVASQIQFQSRWNDFQRSLLDDHRLAEVLPLAFSVGIKMDHLRDLALAFDQNWDLAADPDRIPWDHSVEVAVDLATVRGAAADLVEAADECRDPADSLREAILTQVAPFLDQLEAADTPEKQVAALRDRHTFKYGNKGRKGNWTDVGSVRALGPLLAQARDEALQVAVNALLQRLAVTARDFIVQLGRQRVAQGRLEFHDLLVLARDLLQGAQGPTVRTALRRRYRRLLLDEFQDTDPIQIQIATLLASDAVAPDGDWTTLDTDRGALFFVGDPKQSIYRFRRADISLFITARDVFGHPEPVRLSTNFRTTPPILDWVNAVFAEVMLADGTSQPEYQPLVPAPGRMTAPVGPGVALLGADTVLERGMRADDVRDVEAEHVVSAVVRAVDERWQVSSGRPGQEAWRDATLGDITVLLPARTALPALERALESRGIPYRAETSSLVYATAEVRDLLLAVRAVADVTDTLALLSALRSPLFGCSDADLVRFRLEHGGRLSLGTTQPPSVPADGRVARALRALRALHLQATWLAPSALLETLCRDRRLFELGHAIGRPRDLWRRLRFVVDHARAWEEAEGGTLREYVEWARFQASDSARVAESILPETDDDAVRIMTIHGAKGLEFPITIVSGLSSKPGGRNQGVQVMWPPGREVQIRTGAGIQSEHFEEFKALDEQMDHHERIRLLYVACTRARDHLVVSLVRKEGNARPDGDRATNAELLAHGHEVSGAVAGAIEPTDRTYDAVALPATTPRPSLRSWQAVRDEALRSSGRRRTIGASAVAGLLVESDDGHRKDPVDLEEPAWRKGRYGSAIGRAVHAVLQTVDLRTGEGIDAAAAGQAAAEGVLGGEAEIAEHARAALRSPTVRAAASASQRWRETYVATRVGDVTLEGYIDLLYRDTEGRLVVVDYKTTSQTDDQSLARRTAGYRAQGAAYAAAVAAASSEPVARVVFVYLGPDGAHERELEDLDQAVAEVTAAVVAGGTGAA